MARVSSVFHRLAIAPLVSVMTEAAIAQAGPVSGAAAVERTYLERAAITAADQKCSLFTEGERLALASGLYQARNELLRADYAIAQIEALTKEVGAHAQTLGCDHTSVQNVAATIRDSYRQFAKSNFLTFPGRSADWDASRSIHDTWAIKQKQAETGAVLGLRRVDPASLRPGRRPSDMGEEKVLQLAATIPATDRPPSRVQLLVRDPAKLSEPWIGGLMGNKTGLTPAPRALSTPLWSGRHSNEWAARDEPIYVFHFGEAAIARIEALDPREAVVLELTPSPHAPDQTPRRILFEAGDFAAARSFALIPKPTVSASLESADAEPAAH